ncbi:winged helix-turn-helix domain-containing protein [Roseovarius aestuariivivens]|uniref:winged helix-turn-helix domain-containing protein n=1 Tax=Roseovarius aestuariivivens TaxID=1888910 RepID=UPI001AEC1B10|nr:crosslink repair DNA glycosylase YcaQ family protein [Roseovarius aestuariivivens]
MTAPLEIDNRRARALWLTVNGLAGAQVGSPDVMAIIRMLGFVQIDTVRNVTRAHHHILWSRNMSYREHMLWPRLESRDLFEHFTHDASLIPMEILPMWSRQFRRLGERTARAPWYQSGLGQEEIARIRARIAREGALSTHAFDTKADRREIWARPPHKRALDQMWYAGDLATSHRRSFVKFYDLGERVFPFHPLEGPPEHEAADWLCDAALGKLAMASCGEIQRFWDAMTADEARTWMERRRLVPLRIESADGTWREAWGCADIEARLAQLPELSERIRLLNPFDPAIRDRSRLQRLFGFEYRNEMFVPKHKRRWGYYVYPLLERDRFVGRIELCADRKAGWMKVSGFWPEPGVRWGVGRSGRLDAELRRFARLAGVKDILWHVPEPA